LLILASKRKGLLAASSGGREAELMKEPGRPVAAVDEGWEDGD
jgi:hypothetical protein